MLDTDNTIEVLGARVHNLKNIDVSIPREKQMVIPDFRVLENHHWHLILFMLRDNADM
jgi:hypothetical protein